MAIISRVIFEWRENDRFDQEAIDRENALRYLRGS